MSVTGAAFVDVRTREEIRSQTSGRVPQGASVLPLDDWVGHIPPMLQGKTLGTTVELAEP